MTPMKTMNPAVKIVEADALSWGARTGRGDVSYARYEKVASTPIMLGRECVDIRVRGVIIYAARYGDRPWHVHVRHRRGFGAYIRCDADPCTLRDAVVFAREAAARMVVLRAEDIRKGVVRIRCPFKVTRAIAKADRIKKTAAWFRLKNVLTP